MLLIGAAIIVGLGNLLLPYADNYRDELEQWLAGNLQREVQVERISAQWGSAGPEIDLFGLTLGVEGTENSIRVPQANLRFDLLSWMRFGSHDFGALRIIIEELDLIRDSALGWRVGGMPGSGNRERFDVSVWELLDTQTMVGVNIERLRIIDHVRQTSVVLPGGEISFFSDGNHQRANIRLGSGSDGLSATMKIWPDEERAEVYAQADTFDLATLQLGEWSDLHASGGTIAFQLWMTIKERLSNVSGNFVITDLALADALDEDVYRLARAQTHFSAAIDEDQYRLEFADTAVDRGLDGEWRSNYLGLERKGRTVSIAGDRFVIDDLVDLMAVTPWNQSPVGKLLARHNPRAQLRDIDLTADLEDGTVDGRMTIDNANWVAADGIPGISNLSLTATFDGSVASVDMDIRKGVIDLGEILRAPLEEVDVTTRVLFDWQDALSVSTDHVGYSDPFVTFDARLGMQWNGGRPFLDLALEVEPADVASAYHYWVIPKTPPPVLEWLDSTLQSGRVTEGQMVLYGDLDDWPFWNAEGRFDARAHIVGLNLNYLPDWPEVKDIEADVRFTPVGMHGTVSSATTSGNQIHHAQVDLPRFKIPVIALSLRGEGSGENLEKFLMASPVREKIAAYSPSVDVEGIGEVSADFTIPLKSALGQVTVTGKAHFDDARLVDTAWDVVFENTSGDLHFTRDDVSAEKLATRFRGVDAQLTLHAGTSALDNGARLEGILESESDMSVLLPEFLRSELEQPLENAWGRWSARMFSPVDDDRTAFVFSGEATSLTGLFPAPLKSSDETTRVHLSLDDVRDPRHVEARWHNSARLLLDRSPGTAWTGLLHFGDGPAPPEPESGVFVSGTMGRFDADGWIRFSRRLAGATPTITSMEFAGANLTTSELLLAGRSFDDMELKVERRSQHWLADVRGPAMTGQVRLPTAMDTDRLVSAQFDRLAWPEAQTDAPDANFDPQTYPPIDFYAADLSMGDARLGEVRFESFPSTDGLHIDNLTSQTDDLRIRAEGDWFSAGSSAFAITITANETGAAMQQLGFSEVIDGGQLVTQINARWDGAPTEFELSRLNGSLDLSIGRGQITEVEPGAGRILGLLSLQALPRRLLLDFSDLFTEGLSYDGITGTFSLDDGTARTADLVIEGPTVTIAIAGETDLANRQYDQTITVIPKVGNALPIVGALAGGGVGAAALFVLQGVFENQINKITQYHYAVTGSWEEPTVVLMGADQIDSPNPPLPLEEPASTGDSGSGNPVLDGQVSGEEVRAPLHEAGFETVGGEPEDPGSEALSPSGSNPTFTALREQGNP